jgi:hypothetical protein
MDLAERFAAAQTFDEFVAGAKKNQELWRGIYRLARVPDGALERAAALGARYHLLILVEDWCGDAVNTVPPIVRVAEQSGAFDVRLLGRDANPDLMHAHLTGASRSIPVVLALDADFRECGWWGPRPTELQRWVLEVGLGMPSAERYKVIRAWYARDQAHSTLNEVLGMLERCSVPTSRPSTLPDLPTPLSAH